ncbi:MAG: metalloregulator ArsR/SmtB family transcription factor [Chloroflexi bacterium]|nr:metalloregulator ArsR/SmtB family transcription factor [Chloroflexota bacterium]
MNGTLPQPATNAHALTLSPDVLPALQAIAEPNRARIVALLNHGEHCVCDVGDALGLGTALVSHHLRVLRAAGLLRERHSGRWVFYALDLERLGRLRADLDALLTPSDSAAAECLCSACGTKGTPPSTAVIDRLPDLLGSLT